MITPVQMRKLYKIIRESPDADETSKKALIWAFRKTRMLTIPVVVCILDRASLPDSVIAEQVRVGAHDIISAVGTAHLNDFLRSIGSDFIVHDARHKLGVLISRNSWLKDLQKGTKIFKLKASRLKRMKL